MDFDKNFMISKSIQYTITIKDVSTPTSTLPLKYSIATTFNGVKNQQFSKFYAIDLPFPLEAEITKSNNTIN